MLEPSGTGKTTCLMMLVGFASHTNSEIILDSQPIKALTVVVKAAGARCTWSFRPEHEFIV